jgi:hypothetical protein
MISLEEPREEENKPGKWEMRTWTREMISALSLPESPSLYRCSLESIIASMTKPSQFLHMGQAKRTINLFLFHSSQHLQL